MIIWYAFQTVPQSETRASQALGRLALEVFLPMEKQRRRKRHRDAMLTVHVPMFRGYVFATFDGEPPWPDLEGLEDERGRRVLRSAPHHVVRYRKDGSAAQISDAAMYELKVWCAKFSAANGPKDLQALQVGDLVRIKDGPFRSFKSSIEKLDQKKQRLTVLASLFGRPTSIELEFRQVEAAA